MSKTQEWGNCPDHFFDFLLTQGMSIAMVKNYCFKTRK
jgi:hypothetical protein